MPPARPETPDGARARAIVADGITLVGLIAPTWFLFNWNLVGFHF